MAEYYKWYKDLSTGHYVFATPIIPKQRNAVITITIFSPGSKLGWEVDTSYIPPTRWTQTELANSIDEEIIYKTLKGQKGKIIADIFKIKKGWS